MGKSFKGQAQEEAGPQRQSREGQAPKQTILSSTLGYQTQGFYTHTMRITIHIYEISITLTLQLTFMRKINSSF